MDLVNITNEDSGATFSIIPGEDRYVETTEDGANISVTGVVAIANLLIGLVFLSNCDYEEIIDKVRNNFGDEVDLRADIENDFGFTVRLYTDKVAKHVLNFAKDNGLTIIDDDGEEILMDLMTDD